MSISHKGQVSRERRRGKVRRFLDGVLRRVFSTGYLETTLVDLSQYSLDLRYLELTLSQRNRVRLRDSKQYNRIRHRFRGSSRGFMPFTSF